MNRLVLRRSCMLQRSLYSTTAAKSTPNTAASPAQLLVGLKQQELGKELTQEEADNDAREWIQSLKEMKQVEETISDKSLVNAVYQMKELQRTAKFVATQEQKEEALRAKQIEIPQRKDETMDYLTNVIMRHGRKASAQRTMARALYLVHLEFRQDPVLLLKDSLEKMAPLLKMKRFTDGGARAELVPVPLSERQRLRQAWLWIVDGSKRRTSKEFSVRLGEEMIAAIKGNSSGYEKKEAVHKLGVSNRAFMKLLKK